MSAQEYAKIIAEQMHSVLKPMGFRKSGLNFSAEREDVILMVQLQKSTKTTASKLVATVNLGVFSRTLGSKQPYPVNKPTIPQCHWSERIGFLLSAQHDVWWEVSGREQAVAVGAEIAGLLQKHALPAMEEVDSTARLQALWEKGRSPGLGEMERQQYLELLTRQLTE
jgi:hypothetical protein